MISLTIIYGEVEWGRYNLPRSIPNITEESWPTAGLSNWPALPQGSHQWGVALQHIHAIFACRRSLGTAGRCCGKSRPILQHAQSSCCKIILFFRRNRTTHLNFWIVMSLKMLLTFNPILSQLSTSKDQGHPADASQMSRKMDRGELSRLLPSVDPRSLMARWVGLNSAWVVQFPIPSGIRSWPLNPSGFMIETYW